MSNNSNPIYVVTGQDKSDNLGPPLSINFYQMIQFWAKIGSSLSRIRNLRRNRRFKSNVVQNDINEFGLLSLVYRR